MPDDGAPGPGLPARRPASRQSVGPVVWNLPPARRRADIPELCSRLDSLLAGTTNEVVIIDLAGASRPDAVTVETLARLALTARRRGRSIRVRAPDRLRDLRDLLVLTGLTGPVALADLNGPAGRPAPGRPADPAGPGGEPTELREPTEPSG